MSIEEENDELEATLTHLNRLKLVTVKLADFNMRYVGWVSKYRRVMLQEQREDFIALARKQLDLIEELAETVDDVNHDFSAIVTHFRDTYTKLVQQFREVTESEAE